LPEDAPAIGQPKMRVSIPDVDQQNQVRVHTVSVPQRIAKGKRQPRQQC
jgi:hypothetical protein